MDRALHTLFVDESGNAGMNYLDEEQPFHIAAGVLIANTDLPPLRQVMKSALLREEAELKGARLLRHPDGQRRALNVINAICEAGVMPFFMIMERRFAIAGKLVDVFLDPMHQDAVDWLPTSAIEERQEISERLLDILDGGILDGFAKAYKNPKVDEFAHTLRDVIICLRSHGEDQLVGAFEGALACVANIVESETYGDDTSDHGQWASLNLPAFAHLLRQVDLIMDGRSGLFDVVHDRTRQFESLFERMTKMFSIVGAQAPDLRLSDGRRYRGIYRNFGSFRTDDSISEPALQAADLISSTVARVTRLAVRPGDDWSDELQQLAEVTLPSLLITDDSGTPLVSGIYAHERTKTALFARIVLHGRTARR